MRRKVFAALVIVGLLVALLPAPVGAGDGAKKDDDLLLPIAVDISHRLKNVPAPAQPSPEEAAAIVALSTTTTSQCFGDDSTLTITIPSFDPANPGSQPVVFFKETPTSSTGKATLWVAWDFLITDYGRIDEITCEQLAYLQSQMDSIVDTDVDYFGDYTQRPAGNENIDVMIYNIVDESYFDPTFPFYIAGFFWGSLNETFDQNMIFIDSYDWENRLGPDAARPYLYEGVVAHELEHLIHNDHDANEDSWVDEGLADLAEYLNGFGHPDSHVVYYLAFHRTSLTVWGGGLEDYGASYLFQLYLLENFGDKDSGGNWLPGWTLSIVNEQDNGIKGVEDVTGDDLSNVFHDWVLANYLDNPGETGTGGYPLGYEEINFPFRGWSIQRSLKDIYGSDYHGQLPIARYYAGQVQFPVDEAAPHGPVYFSYKGFEPSAMYGFYGVDESGVEPHEGNFHMYSGGGHLLTDRMFTLSSATTVGSGGYLDFWTWFDIENEWDYGFVEVSTDGGTTWTKIPGNITKYSNNPNHSTAWANAGLGADSDVVITGKSDGWVLAHFGLPSGNVLVRFSYYTDEAVNGVGWYIDELTIGDDGGVIFSDDFEAGVSAWDEDGWILSSGLVQNRWSVIRLQPFYDRGRLVNLGIDTFSDLPLVSCPPYLGTICQRTFGELDTSRLNKDVLTFIMYNDPELESPFNAGFQFRAQKGDASG